MLARTGGAGAAPVMPREVSRRAVERLLRGGTWPGLAREIAWEAVRSSGVEPRCLDWLTGLVEGQLAARIDALAATAAAGATGEALSRVYVEVLEWAVGLLDDRTAPRRTKHERPRLAPLRRLRARSAVEVPSLVAEDLTSGRDVPPPAAPSEDEAAA